MVFETPKLANQDLHAPPSSIVILTRCSLCLIPVAWQEWAPRGAGQRSVGDGAPEEKVTGPVWASSPPVALWFRVSCQAIGALRSTPAGNSQQPAGTGPVIGSVIRPACACEIATAAEYPYPSSSHRRGGWGWVWWLRVSKLVKRNGGWPSRDRYPICRDWRFDNRKRGGASKGQGYSGHRFEIWNWVVGIPERPVINTPTLIPGFAHQQPCSCGGGCRSTHGGACPKHREYLTRALPWATTSGQGAWLLATTPKDSTMIPRQLVFATAIIPPRTWIRCQIPVLALFVLGL